MTWRRMYGLKTSRNRDSVSCDAAYDADAIDGMDMNHDKGMQ